MSRPTTQGHDGGTSPIWIGVRRVGRSRGWLPRSSNDNPPPSSRVPNVISVSGTGDIPSDRHLWIFVLGTATKLYYPQGNVGPSSGPWVVPGVIFGAASTEDDGKMFTVFALLVDDSADAQITKFDAIPNAAYAEQDWQASLARFIVGQVQPDRD